MKQVKATTDDMRRMLDFFGELEEMFQPTRYGAWLAIDHKKLAALVTKHWGHNGPGVGASWRRVLYGMETLLKHCTDPDAATLEWRPDIRAWLESQTAESR
ncbi:hypothetical protein LCGC14_2089710 [marine sediment metagenome]|uniref:Uncharacterized protein n=1 Tax=marine sediment metagenome TaxID=412755 RepID=A0A0F9GRA4_9ZZZZ